MWRGRAGVQVFRKKLHIFIHLDYTKVEFLSCILKKEKKKKRDLKLKRGFQGKRERLKNSKIIFLKIKINYGVTLYLAYD